VGIAGEQTGIYPLVSPGGWRLIGLTPVKVYDPSREESVPYRPGDRVRFRSVDRDEFRRVRDLAETGAYDCVAEGGT
jgi:allophanate hydrolase subunit 1